MKRYFIEGHALMSREGFIADSKGEMFPFLYHPLDWEMFQKRLDEASYVVLGRKGHEKHPNKERKRLVLTTQVKEPFTQDLVTFWNPAFKPFTDLGLTGLLAITGGQSVFEHFLKIGYDRFILNTLPNVALGQGLSLFSQPVDLNKHGMYLYQETVLNTDKLLTSQEWARL